MTPPKFRRRRAPALRWRITMIVLFALVLFSATADQPFHLDNMDFPAVANEASSTGLPVYYRGQDNPTHLGLYHPPLFIYTLAAWIRLLGFGELQIRMFGFLCAVLQAWVVLAICGTLLGRSRAVRMAPWLLFIFLFHPYTLQTASIVDIDSTIYGPLLCGILLATLRITWRNGEMRADPVKPVEYLLIAALIAIALWAKLTTVLLLLVTLPLFLIGRLGWRKASLVSIAIIGGGLGSFLLTYWMYGRITGLDISYSLQFTIASLERGATNRPGLTGRLLDRYDNFRTMVIMLVLWTGLLPWTVAGTACLLALWRAIRRRGIREAHIAILLALALLTIAYYCAQTLTFASAPFKYTFVYWALMLASAAFLAFLLEPGAELFGRRSMALAAVTFVTALALGTRMIKDDLIFTAMLPVVSLQSWLWVSPAILALAAVLLWTRWPGGGHRLFEASLAAYAGLALAVCLHQSRVPYSTTYDYGQLGFEETVAFLKANTAADAIIISGKDIGFKSNRRYYENVDALYGVPRIEELMKDALRTGRIEYAIFTEGRGLDRLGKRPGFQEWITANTRLIRSFGDYRIYRSKAAESKLPEACAQIYKWREIAKAEVEESEFSLSASACPF